MTPDPPGAASPEAAIRAAADRLAAAGDSRPRLARDPVNLPMIRNWLEALGGGGDPDPATAPPAMIQVWTMPGLHGVRGDDDPLGLMSAVLDQAGYTSVVATDCDQTYHRYLKPGEHLSVRSRLLDVAGPKRTALGEGWFVTTRSTWFSAGDPVATMDFRILKFKPPTPTSTTNLTSPSSNTAPPAPTTSLPQRRTPDDIVATTTSLRPLVTPDNSFFWAGTAVGELRIQRCASCGTLRHPPGPMCPACGVPADGGYLVAAGTGEVFSYVVHHHPPVPGKKLPLVVALVQLPEGVRMVAEMPGVAPDQVHIGMPVRAAFLRVDDVDPLALPAWRPAEGMLPDRVIDVTPTFVISSALATRDFQDVHHDRDRAAARGAQDIFLNILTTTGLVQRYVGDWAPDALIRGISIRLGVPCYAGDTLTLTGRLTQDDGAGQVVTVAGRCRLGDHVTGTVRITRC
ncbi:MAG TPA: OB-fold domain-containing protein [Streptosporangiaceae bacterium]|nr:OB-fold domain-containing protein [Streptosporangiaceae bacterium]